MEKEKITIETIEKLADFSRLDFSQEEKEKLTQEVSGIIEMLDKCALVERLESNDSTYATIEDLREDIASESLCQDDAFLNAHIHKSGYYGVPRVVE